MMEGFLKSNIFEENNDKALILNKIQKTNNFKDSIYDVIKNNFNLKNKRDSMIVVANECDINIINTFDEIKILEFIDRIDLVFDDDENELEMQTTIYKNIIDNKLSIYSLASYEEYILSLNIEDLLGKYEEQFIEYKYIIFELLTDCGQFYTSKFFFVEANSNLKFNDVVNSNCFLYDILDKKNDFCNYTGIKGINLSPRDFYFIKANWNNGIIQKYRQALVYLILTYISNISAIKGNKAFYKLEGYRSVNGNLDIELLINDNINNLSDTLYKIFEWVYENKNNIADRLGIARNIISLYIKDKNIDELRPDVLASMYSSYEIYLKENVERYIEVLNQQVVFLNDLNNQVSNLTSDFSNKFKSNFIGFFTFLYTSLLFNILSTGKINNIFTKEITIITISLLAISFLYLIFSLIESKVSLKKLVDRYERNKSYYSSVLDKSDIDRIFDNDSYLNSDKEYLSKCVIRYSVLWILTIIIIGTVIYILGTTHGVPIQEVPIQSTTVKLSGTFNNLIIY